MVLSVDPGVRKSGVALWTPGGVLKMARLVESAVKEGDGAIWSDMADQIRDALRFEEVTELVIEKPQVYPRETCDPNDLINLTGTVGAVVHEFAACGEVKVYLPREWKGQVPKPERAAEPYIIAERLKKALTPDELATVKLPKAAAKCWDVWDAVGIGFHYLLLRRPR